MSSIQELHEVLEHLVEQRRIVKDNIAWLEDLLKDTYWVEEAWHQVNSFHIDLMRMASKETEALRSISPRP